MKRCIKNGLIIDPKTGLEAVKDIWIKDGYIVDITDSRVTNLHSEAAEEMEIFDASGMWVIPGLVDIHVHLREPGFEHKEEIITGCNAAAKGGFTAICCMPNTKPVIDSVPVLEYIYDKTENANGVRVCPSAAITKDMAGKELTDMEKLAESGAYAFTDDGKCVASYELMKKCMEKAQELNMPVFSHPEDTGISAGGAMNMGEVSEAAGAAGIPPEAEEIMIARDILLSKQTGCRVHIQHVSSAMGADMIRIAKKNGVKVTAETAPHYFTLSDEDVTEVIGCEDGGELPSNYTKAENGLVLNANRKMNPPLRTHDDMLAIREALTDGTIDAIATDHAPHAASEKARDFENAPFGVSGLETSFAVSYTTLVLNGDMKPRQLVRCMSTRPAEILGIEAGSIEVGKPADIAVIDVSKKYTIRGEEFVSKGKNTPFEGMEVYGVVEYTIAGGNIIYKREEKR